jgi:hypothetical protein
MSDTDSNATPGDPPLGSAPRGDYDVGYGKPPAAHRFKHGNKANPKGRRKGSRNRKLVIQDVLFEPVAVRENGEVKKMPALEAVLKKTLAKALTGDNKAALTIIGIAQREGILSPEQEEAIDDMSANDLAILEDVRRRLETVTMEQTPEDGTKTGGGSSPVQTEGAG